MDAQRAVQDEWPVAQYSAGAIVQSIGGRIPSARWRALATDEFVEWLMTCHNDDSVVLRVYTHLMDTVDKLELVGPRTDPKWAKKLRGHDGLSEARFNDRASRAFRSFFRFGRQGDQRVIVFADGDSKTSDDFLEARYAQANRRVLAAMASHGVRPSSEW